MLDYSDPIVIIANVITFTLIYAGAYVILTPRIPTVRLLIFSAAFIAVGYTVTASLTRLDIARFFFGNIIFGLPVVLFYGGRIFKRLLYMVSTLVCVLITELICAFLFPVITPEMYLSCYSTYLAVFFCAMSVDVFVFLTVRSSYLEMPYHDSFALVFLPASQFMMLLGWIRYVRGGSGNAVISADGTVSIIITVFLCAASDVLLYESIKRSVSSARLAAENEALESQVKAQERYYSALQEQFTTIREIRHDISNHMYTVNALISEGRSSEASDYAREYMDYVASVSPERICDDPSANAFLGYKLDEIRKAGIKAEFNVRLGSDSGIPDIEIVTLLGNLLDNAIEACTGTAEPYIKLTVNDGSGYVLLSTENPYSENGRHEQKFRGMSRGAGFSIMSGIAEKHSGTLTHEGADGIFRCSVSLKKI